MISVNCPIAELLAVIRKYRIPVFTEARSRPLDNLCGLEHGLRVRDKPIAITAMKTFNCDGLNFSAVRIRVFAKTGVVDYLTFADIDPVMCEKRRAPNIALAHKM